MTADSYRPFMRLVIPPMDIAQLGTEFLVGRARSELKTPITGSWSNVLRYKGVEAAVTSFQVKDEDMILQQLQGAKSRVSWRVATGMRWSDFLLTEAMNVAKTRGSEVRRLGMPRPELIENIEGARSESAVERYKAFIVIAGLQWSQQDRLYVADVSRR